MNMNNTVMSAKHESGTDATSNAFPVMVSRLREIGSLESSRTLQSDVANQRLTAYAKRSTGSVVMLSKQWAKDVLDRRRDGEPVADVMVYRALVISGDAA